MKKLLFLLGIIAGCASPQEIARENKFLSEAKNELASSLANSKISCDDKPTCEKVFSLTKIYIQDNSDMRIQHSDETIVSTYTPTKYSQIGFNANKMPEGGGRETISITVIMSCGNNEYDPDRFDIFCLRKMASIYKGYKSFIDERLK